MSDSFFYLANVKRPQRDVATAST